MSEATHTEGRFADCGIHQYSDMDEIYTCVLCYLKKKAAAVKLAEAVLVQFPHDDDDPTAGSYLYASEAANLRKLARAFQRAKGAPCETGD